MKVKIIFDPAKAKGKHCVDCDDCYNVFIFEEREVLDLNNRLEIPKIICPGCGREILLNDLFRKFS